MTKVAPSFLAAQIKWQEMFVRMNYVIFNTKFSKETHIFFIQGSEISPSHSAQKPAGRTVETAELRSFSEELYRLDSNSVGSRVNVNYQGQIDFDAKNDLAPQP